MLCYMVNSLFLFLLYNVITFVCLFVLAWFGFWFVFVFFLFALVGLCLFVGLFLPWCVMDPENL